MKLSVESDALVMPSKSGSPWAGAARSHAHARSLRSKMYFSTCSSDRKPVSPTSITRTRRSIWRTTSSMCLSLILTPCRR